MSRKQFVTSNGATCKNWAWSWSFVNHTEKFVIFGAWDRFADKSRQLILSTSWRINPKGKRSNGYPEALKYIDFVEHKGYKLFTFPMKYSEEDGVGKIAGFTPILTEKTLSKTNDSWYAVDPDAEVPLTEEISDPTKHIEGAKSTVVVNAYERSASARSDCLQHYGYNCVVCGFNFERVYGETGKDFIHVHHIVPIGTVGEEYEVDPIKDLVPVCPNCHAMIHRPKVNLEIEELKAVIRGYSDN